MGANNVAEYVEAVAHATLREGIEAQLSAFKCARHCLPAHPMPLAANCVCAEPPFFVAGATRVVLQ